MYIFLMPKKSNKYLKYVLLIAIAMKFYLYSNTWCRRRITVCIEYQSFSPFVGIRSPTAYSASERVSPTLPAWVLGGEPHSLAGEGLGRGGPIPTKGQKLYVDYNSSTLDPVYALGKASVVCVTPSGACMGASFRGRIVHGVDRYGYRNGINCIFMYNCT